MTAYKIVRSGRYYFVREVGTELIQTRTNTKAAAQAWIAREARRATDHAWFAAREREARIENIRAYLARRAARPKIEQLSLFA